MALGDESDGGDTYSNSFDALREPEKAGPDVLREDLPIPFTIWGRESMRKILEQNYRIEVAGVQQLAGRPLNQQELDGMLYWSNREIQLRWRGYYMGMLAGGYRFWTTRETFNFPFYKPREGFNPDVLGPLRGLWARQTYHVARAFAYCGIAGPILGALLTTSYAISISGVGRLSDTRTKGLFAEIRQRAETNRRERERELFQKVDQAVSPHSRFSTASSPPVTRSVDDNSPQAFVSDSQEFSQDPAADSAYNPQRSSNPESTSQYGSYTPPSGNTSQYGSYTSASGSSSQYGNYTPPSGNTASTQTVPSRQPQAQPSTSGRPQYQEPQGSQSTDFFGNDSYDDASPTAQPPPLRSSKPQSTGGSSWDRLRTDTGSGTRSGRQEYLVRGNADGSFSRPDEENQLAKSAAQQEFDRQLERERQGRNFD